MKYNDGSEQGGISEYNEKWSDSEHSFKVEIIDCPNWMEIMRETKETSVTPRFFMFSFFFVSA